MVYWLNWNLEMLDVVQGEKPNYEEKNHWSKGRTNKKLDPYLAVGWD